MNYLLPAAYAVMVLAAFLLPTTTDRLRGSLGLPAFVLGVASVPHLPAFQGPSLGVWISAALLLLGPALLLLAAWRAQARSAEHRPAALLATIAAVAGVAAAWPTLTKGGPLPAALTAGALGLGTWFLWLLGAALGLGRGVRWIDARLPSLSWRHGWGVLVLVAGAIGVGIGSSIWPLWVLSWQPIGVGIGVAAAWWAVATGRASLGLAGAAVAAAFCAVAATIGAWLLPTAAALIDSAHRRVVAVLAALAAYIAAPILLGAEVLFTVLLTGAATMLLAAMADRAVDTERATV